MVDSSTARKTGPHPADPERARRLAEAGAALRERFAAVVRSPAAVPSVDRVDRHGDTNRGAVRPADVLRSGWEALDEQLGGLAPGESLYVRAEPGAGGLALLGDWLARAVGEGRRVALIDAEGTVGPEIALPPATAQSTSSTPCWVVRTEHGWVAVDLLLRSGGFDLVALVGVPPADRGRVGPRLTRLLAEHGSRLLVLGSSGSSGSSRASPPFRPDHSVSVSLAAVEWSASPVGDAPRRRTFRVETAGAVVEVCRDDCSIDRLRRDPLAPDRRSSRKRARKR